MSYDLSAYATAPCTRADLERAFASSFPEHALQVLAWDAAGGQLSIELRGSARAKRPVTVTAAIEIDTRSLSAPPALDLPRSKARALAALRVEYAVSVREEHEIAAAWLALAALAVATSGFVDDPQDGVTKTAAEAKRSAARIAKGALTDPPAEREEHLTPEERENERRVVFGVALGRHVKDGTFARFLEETALDEGLLAHGLALSKDQERADVSLALARRAPAPVLEAHAVQAARAPGLRSRLYMEHLAAAGVLELVPVAGQRQILAHLTAQREPALVAMLKARGLG